MRCIHVKPAVSLYVHAVSSPIAARLRATTPSAGCEVDNPNPKFGRTALTRRPDRFLGSGPTTGTDNFPRAEIWP